MRSGEFRQASEVVVDPKRSRRGDARTAAIAGILVAGLLAAPEVPAQELLPRPEAAGETAPVDVVDRDEIDARRAAVGKELVEAESAIAAAHDGPQRAHLEAVRDDLHAIEALLRQQAELAELFAQPRRGLQALPEAASASVAALDRLYELQFESLQESERREQALAASREALGVAKERLEEAERRRRETRDALEAIPAGVARSEAERTLRIRQLSSRDAQARVHLRTLETRLARRAREQEGGQEELAARIEAMRDELARGAGTSENDDGDLTRQALEIRRSRDALGRRLASAELRFEAARDRLSRESEPSAEFLERLDALAAERDAVHLEIELVDSQLERAATQRVSRRRWASVLRGEGTREELESWKAAAAERVDELEQSELWRRGQAEDLKRRLDALDGRSRSSGADSPIHAALEEHQGVLSRLLDAQQAEIAALAHARRSSERLLAELRVLTGETGLREYAVRGARIMRTLWAYEIAETDDSSITVGSVALALLFAGLGFWISRRGAKWIAAIATGRFKLDAGAAHALQALSFYVLLVSFTMLALRAVHFPLTAFTVLGGALAIGIGFGSQNVMNNFISGLILLLERPVRARDIVEVDGNYGTIENIGARSTQIRSHDGRHIVVPNSYFLESNVVNWTLSDDLIRTSVKVGVIYGSPIRLVEELIQRVVGEDEKILATPQPIVIFDEFGDNSLNFEVHFWVRGRSPMEVRIVQSRVRFRIDDLFREHRLVIAFPQRDVHLDSTAPIEVRLTQGGES